MTSIKNLNSSYSYKIAHASISFLELIKPPKFASVWFCPPLACKAGNVRKYSIDETLIVALSLILYICLFKDPISTFHVLSFSQRKMESVELNQPFSWRKYMLLCIFFWNLQRIHTHAYNMQTYMCMHASICIYMYVYVYVGLHIHIQLSFTLYCVGLSFVNWFDRQLKEHESPAHLSIGLK